jgi:hypothetical protein
MHFHACTYGVASPRGFTGAQDGAWRRSLHAMFQATGCDTLLLPVVALQNHAYSTRVDFDTPDVMDEADIRAVCQEARALGKKVILKAMVNCRDGYWRAYIRFFDAYVPTEPTWNAWFSAYQAFVVHLAAIAQTVQAELFCVGCEMVGTDHRAEEWRKLVRAVRQVYAGAVTYNCDKYQEDRVSWWDCLDVISSSGYYPIDGLEQAFERIHGVMRREGKPFLFMECGCPSRAGSERVPNDWQHPGALDLSAQDAWYRAFTAQVLRSPWVHGVGWWDWSATKLYPEEQGVHDDGYCVHGKPAQNTVQAFSRAWSPGLR